MFYSFEFSTYGYTNCHLEFKSYINHSSGGYTLHAGYCTTDPSDQSAVWIPVWNEIPSSSGKYPPISVNIPCGEQTLYIGFWVEGDPDYFNYWYIDDVNVTCVCCLEIVDIYLDYNAAGDKCNRVCVTMKNNCDHRIDDVELTMDFYITPPDCPCGGLGFLTKPDVIMPNDHYQYVWTGALAKDGHPNSEKTKCTSVKGCAYFDLEVTLSSADEGCSVTETRSGFVGLQLY